MARTGCNFNELRVGTCQTGDCDERFEYDGMGAILPASLFQITLGTGIEKDYYDVSFVDGYNLSLVATPQGVYGECNATGSATDINMGMWWARMVEERKAEVVAAVAVAVAE
ncbi:Thaumatin-like protein [Camellia lanceoleosa]|uniref:Thaumatin-like protein n=1 Tax=Camellia lanceoleosa TaxID=1840588 RepID=A0ACC0FP27_9ERIC|nr:Thaumatin-like protein [Camellia lanceoleosa]